MLIIDIGGPSIRINDSATYRSRVIQANHSGNKNLDKGTDKKGR